MLHIEREDYAFDGMFTEDESLRIDIDRIWQCRCIATLKLGCSVLIVGMYTVCRFHACVICLWVE